MMGLKGSAFFPVKRPTVALLTDFGTADPYVGMMKGVIRTHCPEAHLIDLSHEVPPQNIMTGAFLLRSAVNYFPQWTVFLCVVDPGVGSSRKAVALRADGYYFVGPDNGIFPAAMSIGIEESVELTEKKFHHPYPSPTFHGRDIFAPVAAQLAKGLPLSRLGRKIKDLVWRELPKPFKTKTGWTGEVMWVDHFGNLITNLEAEHLPKSFRLKVGKMVILNLVTHFAQAKRGGVLALVGSSGNLEICVNGGNAAEKLGVGIGTSVALG